jgi:hypothetical protein
MAASSGIVGPERLPRFVQFAGARRQFTVGCQPDSQADGVGGTGEAECPFGLSAPGREAREAVERVGDASPISQLPKRGQRQREDVVRPFTLALVERQRGQIDPRAGKTRRIPELFEGGQRTVIPRAGSGQVAALALDIAKAVLEPGRAVEVLQAEEDRVRLFAECVGLVQASFLLERVRLIAQRLGDGRLVPHLLRKPGAFLVHRTRLAHPALGELLGGERVQLVEYSRGVPELPTDGQRFTMSFR